MAIDEKKRLPSEKFSYVCFCYTSAALVKNTKKSEQKNCRFSRRCSPADDCCIPIDSACTYFSTNILVLYHLCIVYFEGGGMPAKKLSFFRGFFFCEAFKSNVILCRFLIISLLKYIFKGKINFSRLRSAGVKKNGLIV